MGRGLSRSRGEVAHAAPSIPPARGAGARRVCSRLMHTGWFFPRGAAAEAGVAAGLPEGTATGLCPQARQCHHPGDLLPPPSFSPTRLNVFSLFPAQRQQTPLLPLPGAGPYARPAGGPPAAAPRLGQGHLRSRPERDGCPGGTDKAGRRQPWKGQHAPVVCRYSRKTGCGVWGQRRRLHRHWPRGCAWVAGGRTRVCPLPSMLLAALRTGSDQQPQPSCPGPSHCRDGGPGPLRPLSWVPTPPPPFGRRAEPAGPCLIKLQILIH